MEMIMMGINESWIWLGPLLIFCLFLMLQHVVADIFRGAVKEMRSDVGSQKSEVS